MTSPDGNTFPQRFIDSLLDRLVNRWHAAETVRMLARFGWWTARRQQIDGHIAFHMSQQLNLAFGRTVHRTGPDEAYVGVVEDLLKGTLLAHAHYQERFLIVMYLVKHSVPTYGRWYLEVDRSLARYRPARSALRPSSREIVDGLRPNRAAIVRSDSPAARASAISSRSANDK